MPRTKQTRTHVHQNDDPLPAPLTTRNLLPRLRTASRSHTASTQSASSQRDTPSPSRPASRPDIERKGDPRLDEGMDHSDSESDYNSSTQPASRNESRRSGKRRRREDSAGGRQLRPRLSRPASSDLMNISGGPSLFASSSSTNPSSAPFYADVEEFDISGHDFAGSSGAAKHDAAPLSDPPGPSTSGSTLADKHTSSPASSPVTSPSLLKILNAEDVDVKRGKGKGRAGSKGKGKGKAKEEVKDDEDEEPEDTPGSPSPPSRTTPADTKPEAENLAEYTCPICFFPPSNATLTPCGHICCGSCLFTAVKSTMKRGAMMMAEDNKPKCPVCRAELVNWDGQGGGVIGLRPRAVISL